MPNQDSALKAATKAETNAVKDANTDYVRCLPSTDLSESNAIANFTAFQLLAYRMPTFYPLESDSYLPDSKSSIGRGLDPVAQALLQRFASVLNHARLLSKIDTNPATLKVFVAPEFYFKGPGQHWGSFSFNTMINMLDALKSIGASVPDWLVIADRLDTGF